MLPNTPYRHRKPWHRTAVHWLRRGHLFAGLLLLPWVFLYGITAFLFNHPTAFSDQPSTAFTSEDQVGTPLESLPSPSKLAEEVVAALNARQAGTTHTLVEPETAKYAREFAFATVKTETDEISVLVEVNGSGGTIRSRPIPPPPVEEPKAPFAIGRSEGRPAAKKGGGGPPKDAGPARDGLFVPEPLHERVKAAVPTLLQKHGFATGEVTVTSVPDLVFLMDAHGQKWRVTWNAQTGRVSGKSADEQPTTEISTRRFLLRLHTAHGYPSDDNARWYWAVIVDAMAFIMVFWGVSGLFMWWQIKAMRKIGGVLLLISIAGATWVGYAMHTQMTGG